jgi:hypothetical protein
LNGSSTAGASLPDLSVLVLQRARLRLHRLQEELGTLRAAYAGRDDLPGLRTLVSAMQLLASEAERELVVQARASYDRLRKGAEEALEEERFRGLVAGLINALENSLPNPMQLAREPHGRDVEALIAPFSQMIARLMGDESSNMELIFEPSDDYAYQLSALDEVLPVAGRLSGEQRELRELMLNLPRLTVIAYPRHMEAETLMHAVMAHEVAHLAINKSCSARNAELAEEAFDSAVQDSWREFEAVEVEFEEALSDDEEDPDSSIGERPRSPTEQRAARLKKWFYELLCDALAVALVGPAYPLALADLDGASDRWGRFRAASHPGLAWRLARAIALARKLYLSADVHGEEWDALGGALDRLEARLPAERDGIQEVEREVVERALDALEPTKMVELSFYDPETLQRDLPIVWSKLADGIPPAERIILRTTPGETLPAGKIELPLRWSEPIALPSIFNGAYAWWYAGRARRAEFEGGHRRLPDQPRALEDWLEFNELIRGTIEQSTLHERLWEERERLDKLNPPPEGPSLVST